MLNDDDEGGIANDVVVDGSGGGGGGRNVCPMLERLCDDIPVDSVHRESIMVDAVTVPPPLTDPNALHKESDAEFALGAIVANGFIDKLCVVGNNDVAARKTLFVFFRFFHLALNRMNIMMINN